jgi:hypothetical protein
VEVVKEVPGPERIVEVVKEVPVEVFYEVPVPYEVIKEIEVIREVPGPERIVEVPVEVVKEIKVPYEVVREVQVIKEIKVPVSVTRVVEKPIEVIKEVQVPGPERIVEVEKIVYRDHPLIEKLNDYVDSADLENDSPVNNTTFGTAFPRNPNAGDKFLRVDTNPNTLYRFDGKNWIALLDEMDAMQLINAVISGDLDMEDLTLQQQQVVKKHIKKENVLGK